MFKVHVAGHKRDLIKAVKRALRRRVAVEPVLGHLTDDHRMGRNFLAFSEGDANNAVFATVGYNFSLLLLGAGRHRRSAADPATNSLITALDDQRAEAFTSPVSPALIATVNGCEKARTNGAEDCGERKRPDGAALYFLPGGIE
ncbi:hypothetical protein ACFFNA_36790, partial [Mesorhizobium kowhaii]